MHSLVKRQLKKLNLSAEKYPENDQEWKELIEIISKTYSEADQERYLLERSLVLTSKEMQAKWNENQRILEDLRETQMQLVQSGKMAALGEMAAGIAHEINNPLQFVSGFTEHILTLFNEKKQLSLDEIKDPFQEIEKNCDRIKKIVEHFRDFSRQSEGLFEEADVNEIVKSALDLFQEHLRLRKISVKTNFSKKNPLVWADVTQLEQVIVNLITNGRKAIEEKRGLKGGKIEVTTEVLDGKVVIKICDDGIGIPKEIKEDIFTPFFTTRGVGEGTGLGLSICYALVQEHKGSIVCESVYGEGATFVIQIPELADKRMAS